MPEPISPQGYRKYEPTTNNARFIKFQSQVPIEEYESYRDQEQGTDVVENVIMNLQAGAHLRLNPDCGDGSLGSQGGMAINYAARMFGGHSAERDYFWQEYNRKAGVGASPLVQQATANQFGGRPQQQPQPQQFVQPQPHASRFAQDPAEDFAERIKRIASQARPEPVALQPNMNNDRKLPGMIRTAANSIMQNNMPQQSNEMSEEQVAADIKRRREAMKQRLENMATNAPKPKSVIANNQPIVKNLKFEKI